jgi:hypothetical protein
MLKKLFESRLGQGQGKRFGWNSVVDLAENKSRKLMSYLVSFKGVPSSVF